MLVLRDGSLSIGELQTTALAPAAADNTANEGTDNATDKPAKPSELQKSHYYRTENFDLTNDHYRWFTPEELSASGIIRPEAATLVERFEWGHLYGLQLRIHETLPVDATAQKELDRFTENQKLFQYLQLLPTDAAATDTAPKLVELADAMVPRERRRTIPCCATS